MALNNHTFSVKAGASLPHQLDFTAIGTQWTIATRHSISARLLQDLEELIDTFDETYSRFRSDSLIFDMSQKTGTYHFPLSVIPLITFYHSLYELTQGKVTPLIGRALEEAGYDAVYSLQPKKRSKVPPWDEVMSWKGATVTTTEPITIDFGAAGKGYLIDLITRMLDQEGHIDFVVDGSGDLLHRGTAENIVGLEHPLDHTKVIGALSVTNASICASATNRRAWAKGMHHIFDPVTKEPVRDIIATWAVASDAMIADGLATALFFTDPKVLLQAYTFEYVRMHSDNSIDYSTHLNGELYI
jgi:thiamine biosynthesis lipoprotein